jgi:hypothetical protein
MIPVQGNTLTEWVFAQLYRDLFCGWLPRDLISL